MRMLTLAAATVALVAFEIGPRLACVRAADGAVRCHRAADPASWPPVANWPEVMPPSPLHGMLLAGHGEVCVLPDSGGLRCRMAGSDGTFGPPTERFGRAQLRPMRLTLPAESP